MSRRNGKVETPEYLAMLRRLIRAAGNRVGDADEVDLAELVKMREHIEDAIDQAVTLQRVRWGRSWADIGRGLGISRQAAQQHYGRALMRSGCGDP